MKRPRLIAVLIVLLVLFLPVIKVVVVPSWTIRVVDEQGNPQPDVEVRQHWNHYSFDGSGLTGLYGGEEVQISNSQGEISFAERSFHTGLVRWALAMIGTPFRWINPHASTGPHSYFICSPLSCSETGWYRGNQSDLEKNVLTVESEETIKKRLDKIMEEIRQDLPEVPADESGLGTAPPPPLPKRNANR